MEVYMKVVKVDAVEDILAVRNQTDRIEISSEIVIRYIYLNKNCENQSINIDELRNAYVKSIKKSYAKKRYMDDITLNSGDIRKVCFG